MASMPASVLGSARPAGSSESSSHVVRPGNLSCRAHCLLLTESAFQSGGLENFFMSLWKRAWRRISSLSTDLFSYWLVYLMGGLRWLPISPWEDWNLYFLYWKNNPYPLPPANRLSSDLRGCFLIWMLPSGNFYGLLVEAMGPVFPLRSACIGYQEIILVVDFFNVILF